MAGSLAGVCKHQFFDANGNPLTGGRLFTYAAGGTTKTTTYKEQALSNANANPIILDSAGRCDLWLGPGYWKFVMATATSTSDPPTGGDILWTADSIASTPPVAAARFCAHGTTASTGDWVWDVEHLNTASTTFVRQATNSQIKLLAGTYLITGNGRVAGAGAAALIWVGLAVNGSYVARGTGVTTAGGDGGASCTTIVTVVDGDYITLANSAGNRYGDSDHFTTLSLTKIA